MRHSTTPSTQLEFLEANDTHSRPPRPHVHWGRGKTHNLPTTAAVPAAAFFRSGFTCSQYLQCRASITLTHRFTHLLIIIWHCVHSLYPFLSRRNLCGTSFFISQQVDGDFPKRMQACGSSSAFTA